MLILLRFVLIYVEALRNASAWCLSFKVHECLVNSATRSALVRRRLFLRKLFQNSFLVHAFVLQPFCKDFQILSCSRLFGVLRWFVLLVPIVQLLALLQACRRMFVLQRAIDSLPVLLLRWLGFPRLLSSQRLLMVSTRVLFAVDLMEDHARTSRKHVLYELEIPRDTLYYVRNLLFLTVLSSVSRFVRLTIWGSFVWLLGDLLVQMAFVICFGLLFRLLWAKKMVAKNACTNFSTFY